MRDPGACVCWVGYHWPVHNSIWFPPFAFTVGAGQERGCMQLWAKARGPPEGKFKG